MQTSQVTDASLLKRISEFVPAPEPHIQTAKRQKTPNDAHSQTLEARVDKALYTSLQQFGQDFRDATQQIVSLIQSEAPVPNGTSTAASRDLTTVRRASVAEVNALAKYATSLITRELEPPPWPSKEAKTAPITTNGIKEEPSTEASALDGQRGRSVLTIFGNAAGQKQLFSSLQLPVRAEESVHGRLRSHVLEESVEPLQEESLPHNILRTELFPVNHDEVSPETKRGQTFKDIFSAPPGLQQISPPKPTKPSLARADRLSWAADKRSSEGSRKTGFTQERLPTGHWLGYGGAVESNEPVSPEAKRKRRDRALSTGEAVLTPTDGIKAAQAQAKEEALFRSAYSSFAPVHDNSTALISDTDKGSVWWDRYGRDAFEHRVARPGPYFVEEDSDEAVNGGVEDEDERLEKAVEQFEPVTLEIASSKGSSSMEERESEAILADISEMLETLHSHQRIRNATLSGNPKSSIGANTSFDDLTGTPSMPSSAEFALHDTLRQQLALMISLLPPYAVAKLNGDQLADLNISRHLAMEDGDYRGVMEEDQASRMARSAALSAAVSGAGTAARPATSAAAPSTYRSPAAPPAATPSQRSTGYGHYPSGTVPRASNYARQPLSGWQPPTSQPYASVPRPSYAAPAYAPTPGAASPGGMQNRAAPRANVAPYPARAAGNGQSAYGQRAPVNSYASTAAGFGLGSPVPRHGTPQGYQAPTPQITRPGSSSYGYQSPAGPRPGSGYATGTTAGSPAKPTPSYPTPSASIASGVAAVDGSRPQTPASGGAGAIGSANGTPRAG